MADEYAGGGLPVDSNLVLYPSTTVASTSSPVTTNPISVEPGSDMEVHIAWKDLTSSATLQVDIEASVDGGSNYYKLVRSGTFPTTDDAGGQTIGREDKIHVSAPGYIPKSTQSDAYSGSLLRALVRAKITIGGSGNCENLNIWLAPDDDGSTGPRERWWSAKGA